VITSFSFFPPASGESEVFESRSAIIQRDRGRREQTPKALFFKLRHYPASIPQADFAGGATANE